jgi:hypothetical protein
LNKLFCVHANWQKPESKWKFLVYLFSGTRVFGHPEISCTSSAHAPSGSERWNLFVFVLIYLHFLSDKLKAVKRK